MYNVSYWSCSESSAISLEYSEYSLLRRVLMILKPLADWDAPYLFHTAWSTLQLPEGSDCQT